ncbi:MAG: hypothetical protein GX556_20175 [Fibrobacter sp.]|mgnify:CR=1 FL=1|nr:hypothetical protein [Fibrobacter sp.]
MRKLLWLKLAFFAMVIPCWESYGDLEAPDLTWKGFASLRLGQIVKGEPETVIGKEVKSDMVWVQEMNAGISLESKFNNLPAVGNVGIEFAVNNDNSPYPQDFGKSRRLNFYPYLSRADLLFNLRDEGNAKLELDVGYFPYKYNSSVRNLGEYLFRSGTYPQWIVTEIDFPMARLLGLRFGGKLWEQLDFDILATLNTEWTAIGDLNLSGLVAWEPHPFFEIGLGGSWCSIVSVDWDKTTPDADGSRYLAPIPGKPDTAIYNYTFAGQKLMGRLEFDIKRLFSDVDIFGEEDLKVYCEAAILGLINYPASMDGVKRFDPAINDSVFVSYTRYDTLWQRIPVMVGLNIPFFKLLDVFSVELEWFGNPYPNNLNPIKFDNQPVPLSSFANEKTVQYMNIHSDDWKWSVYARKTFKDNFFVMAQAASDHFRWYRLDFTAVDGKEASRQIDHWYYTLKFGYKF